MTITLAAVYAPIGFVSGLTGALVSRIRLHAGRRGRGVGRHRAHPVADDVLAPAQAAAARGRRGFAGLLDRLFDGLRRRYQRRLHKTLNFRAMTLLILVGVLALTGVMFASTARRSSRPRKIKARSSP